MTTMETRASGRSDRRSGPFSAISPLAVVYLVVISFSCVFYLLNATVMLGHYDLGWHLAAGDLIRSRHDIPFQDPWSFTLADKQWYNLSWLWDVVASAVVQYSGLSGLVVMTVAIGAAIAACLIAMCCETGATPSAAGIAVLFACVLFPAYQSDPNVYLAASPNVATVLLGVVFYREALKATRWYLLPPAMLLWANLHGGFLIGFFIIGVFGAGALLRRDWSSVRSLGIALVGCLIASLVNPLGWHVYSGVIATLGHFVQAYIGEWKSYFYNNETAASIPGLVYIAAFVGLELRRGRVVRIPIETRLLSWLFLGAGFYQFRYLSFFYLFSAVPLSLHLGSLMPDRLTDARPRRRLLAVALLGLCAVPLAFGAIRPSLRLTDMLTARDADYLVTHHTQSRLLNHWNMGGALIYLTHGEVPVFVDGRAATAYPDALLRDYLSLAQWTVDETAWDIVLAKYRIDAILWVKTHEPLRRFLVDRRGWTETHAGDHVSVFAKRTPD